jgi:hypothetical protein
MNKQRAGAGVKALGSFQGYKEMGLPIRYPFLPAVCARLGGGGWRQGLMPIYTAGN